MQPRRMLVGILVGALAGFAARGLAPGAPWLVWITNNVAGPIGQVFLRLLFLLVVPLLFSALVVGVAGIDLRQLGRLGAKTLLYTVVVSFIAVMIGLMLVNTLEPGKGLQDPARLTAGRPSTITAVAPPTAVGIDLVVSMIPDNPVKAAANGDMIGVIIFALIIGISLALTKTEAAVRLRETIQGLYDVSMTAIGGVLRIAPYAVGALLFAMAVRLGTDLFWQIGAYVGVVMLGLALHMFVVYSLLLRFVAGYSPVRFFRGARLAIATAFSTASSSATLPTALKVAEEDLQLPPAVSRFVLTVGATMNQNGTALFEGVTVLFLAQLYGIELAFAQQALVMVICVLAGIGTAGVPAGSLPVIAMILGMFGIPPEGLGLILGVDRLLDMSRTTLNVTGDLVAAVVLSGKTRQPPAADPQSQPG